MIIQMTTSMSADNNLQYFLSYFPKLRLDSSFKFPPGNFIHHTIFITVWSFSIFVWIKHFWAPSWNPCYIHNGVIIITKISLFKYTENFTNKKRKFSDKKFWYFIFLPKTIDCGYLLELPRWGSSNEFPQSMFLSRNKKNNVYPCKPQFYYIKVGFKGVKII